MTSAGYGMAEGETFGPANEAAIWGNADARGLEPEGEGTIRGKVTLSPGVEMEINEEVCRALLYSGEAIAAIRNRAQAVVDLANSMAITEGATYTYVLQTGEGHSRPQCLVMPDSFKGVVDDAAHDTLMKAAAAIGSEEINWGWENVFPDLRSADEAPGSGDMAPGEGDAAAGGEAAGEAAGGEALGEVAAVAAL
jgi:hypothetical protein